jgi:hypothetical protein
MPWESKHLKMPSLIHDRKAELISTQAEEWHNMAAARRRKVTEAMPATWSIAGS